VTLGASTKLLMIEDDVRLAEMVEDYLGEHGFVLNHAEDGESGLRALREGTFDAVLLDVMLPDLDGFEICRRIRADSDVPIVMLTARGEETDRVVGLELGADDYLPKPFGLRELLARIRAVLRRGRGTGADGRRPVLRFGQLEIDPEARVARLEDRDCDLTGYQFDLLLILAERAGRAVSRDTLMELLRGDVTGAFDRSIDVHVSRIRAAIEPDPRHPKRILTVRGTGYLFVRTDSADPGATSAD
jgi:two-component system phosphate regulon response regulator OmpR